MGREIRRVPADWVHPTNESGHPIPMHGRSYVKALGDWIVGELMWRRGKRSDFHGGWRPKEEGYASMPFEEWSGSRPVEEDYMPDWPECERTHLMMYENTTEGTPISPAFSTPEELALWLSDNNASAFGHQGASYESWLAVCKGGWAPSMVMQGGVIRSGVEAMGGSDPTRETGHVEETRT